MYTILPIAGSVGDGDLLNWSIFRILRLELNTKYNIISANNTIENTFKNHQGINLWDNDYFIKLIYKFL